MPTMINVFAPCLAQLAGSRQQPATPKHVIGVQAAE